MKHHLVFDSHTQMCKVFDFDTHKLVFECLMRDKAVHGPGFGRWGRCPRGEYALGRPIDVDEIAMGLTFIPVLNVPGRSGIGIHGWGTGLPMPFASRQGWVETLGCLRVQNVDLARLREFTLDGASRLTVVGL